MSGWSSGTFTRTHNWTNDKNNGIKITSARHDQNDTDFVNGINNCLTKDGQNTATANLPMGGYIHTGVGNATARTNYPSVAQLQDGSLLELVSVSGTNTITAALTPAITAYAKGQLFSFVVGTTNTGATTINIDSVGAKNIYKTIGNALVALVANDLIANTTALIYYDGTQFQLLNPHVDSHGADIASATTTNLDTATGNIVDVTGTTTITGITLAEGKRRLVRFTGALTLTNGASLILPGGENITTVAGDYAEFVGYASGVVRCSRYVSVNYAPQTEGTFTPTLTTTGTDFTSVTYDAARDGTYVKIGNVAHFELIMSTDSVTVGSASGNVVIGGLPFTSRTSSTGVQAAAVSVASASGWAGEVPISAFVMSNSTQIALRYRTAVGGNESATAVADVNTGVNSNNITISGTYITA